MQSQTNFVARNYTICNAMNSKLYELHKGLIIAATEEEQIKEPITLQDINREAHVELVMKHYPQTSTGISKQVQTSYSQLTELPLFRCSIKLTLRLMGLTGEGLDLQERKPGRTSCLLEGRVSLFSWT